jgi:hypothetical protein
MHCIRKQIFVLLIFSGLYSCSTLKDSPKYQLSNDVYKFGHRGPKYTNAYVFVDGDSVSVFSVTNSKQQIAIDPSKDYFFIKNSFDLDVMTVPFKYRPATSGLPRQLNTEFNGNAFIGYRIDRFRLRVLQTPFGRKNKIIHRGITLGAFGGLGSTNISPSTTQNQTADEYNALILTRGLGIMIGINNLTVGLGAGWDYVTDRDKEIWIYQNKPWYGLTVGLNLN